MIMEGILNNWKGFLKEGFTEQGTPDLKYYAFDWDDNIVRMPTKIMLVDTEGNEVGMNTEDFAEYRSEIGKEEFEYEGHTIKDFAAYPFRNFRVEGDNQFLQDVMSADPAESFGDFKKCVEGASIFAIITARGHNPDTLKEACKKYILSGFNGINTDEVIKNIKRYNELYGVTEQEEQTDQENVKSQLVDKYLKLCRFEPVTFGQGSAASPEKLKVEALKKFISYVNVEAKRVKKDAQKGSKIQIGFSDDDPKNIETMIAHFGSRDEKGRFKSGRPQSLKIKYTGKPRGQG